MTREQKTQNTDWSHICIVNNAEAAIHTKFHATVEGLKEALYLPSKSHAAPSNLPSTRLLSVVIGRVRRLAQTQGQERVLLVIVVSFALGRRCTGEQWSLSPKTARHSRANELEETGERSLALERCCCCCFFFLRTVCSASPLALLSFFSPSRPRISSRGPILRQ